MISVLHVDGIGNMILEVCIDSVESARAAQEGGAQRVELCADLLHGGTTPSIGMIQSVREAVSISIHTMIRTRPGDFCYSDDELEVMARDIEAAKKAGSDGVVLGVLTSTRTVDTVRTKTLIDLARPMSVTFHRAIDECADVVKAFGELRQLGVDRILTSGGGADVVAVSDILKTLVDSSYGHPKILAGGGVNFQNVAEVVKKTSVKEVHALSALITEPPPGGTEQLGSPRRYLVDVSKVRQMVVLLEQLQ